MSSDLFRPEFEGRSVADDRNSVFSAQFLIIKKLSTHYVQLGEFSQSKHAWVTSTWMNK